MKMACYQMCVVHWYCWIVECNKKENAAQAVQQERRPLLINIANYFSNVKHSPLNRTTTTSPFHDFVMRKSFSTLLIALFSSTSLSLRKSIIRLSACFSPARSAWSSVYLPNLSILFISHGTPSMVISGVLAFLVRFGRKNSTCRRGILSATRISTISISSVVGMAPNSFSIITSFITYILPRKTTPDRLR